VPFPERLRVLATEVFLLLAVMLLIVNVYQPFVLADNRNSTNSQQIKQFLQAQQFSLASR